MIQTAEPNQEELRHADTSRARETVMPVLITASVKIGSTRAALQSGAR